MSETEIEYMINSTTAELISLAMEDFSWSRIEAMRNIFQSKTYKNLSLPATGLYYQSTLYVYECLREELGLAN